MVISPVFRVWLHARKLFNHSGKLSLSLDLILRWKLKVLSGFLWAYSFSEHVIFKIPLSACCCWVSKISQTILPQLLFWVSDGLLCVSPTITAQMLVRLWWLPHNFYRQCSSLFLLTVQVMQSRERYFMSFFQIYLVFCVLLMPNTINYLFNIL